jgi:PKD repeat protein
MKNTTTLFAALSFCFLFNLFFITSRGEKLIGSAISVNYTLGETVVENNGKVSLGFHQARPPAPLLCTLSVSVTTNNTSCNGCNNGQADANVSDGTPPYMYNWSNGQTMQNIGGLQAGNYCVTVTDNNNCTATACATVNNPPDIMFSHNYTGGCAPQSVLFTNNSSGAVAYEWKILRDNFLISTSNSFNLNYNFTSAGNYEVQLRGFSDSAMTNNVGFINDFVTISGLSIAFSADTACKNDIIAFNVLQFEYGTGGGGGGSNSDYSWNFGDGSPSVTGYNVNHVYSANGTYTVQLIGQTNNCGTDTVYQTVVITNNVVPQVYFNAYEATSCPFDKIEFNAYNAAGTYTWNFGDGSAPVTTSMTKVEHAYSATGNYIVTVSVTNGCGLSANFSDTVHIQNNVGFNQNSNFNYQIKPNPVCPGDAVGFRFEYPDHYSMYIWNYGNGNADTNKLETQHTYQNVGTYNASITIRNGCGKDTVLFQVISVQNNVQIAQGDYDFGITPLNTCPGDSVLFLAENGAQSYLWNYGDGNTGSPAIIPGANFNGVTHAYTNTGSYTSTLTVTNSCGNSRTDTVPFPVTVANNAFPEVSPLFGDAFTPTGEYDDNSLPGCQPISFVALCGGNSFQWNFGDGVTLTTNQLLVSHKYTQAGTYTITLTATNSCGNSATFTRMFTITGSCASPVVSVSGTNPTCNNGNNGSVTANVNGGTPPYTFFWNNGATTATLNGLVSGTYSVTVTDNNGMTGSASKTLANPPAITLNFSAIVPASCGLSNGQATVTASGGATPYTYMWANGQTTQNATGLSAGNHNVTVTAANGCKKSGTAAVPSASGFSVSFSSTNITCNGAANGTATASAAGGSTPYTYQWSNGATLATLSSLAAGTYNATVTDFTGCKITGAVTISQPSVIVLNLNGNNASSCGSADGSVNMAVTGGTPPYTFNWNNGASTQNITGIPAGTYSVTVTDANNCTRTKNTTITAPSGVTTSISKTNAKCNGSCDGTATVTASGGTTPYSYQWSNGKTGASVGGLCNGVYTVTVIEAVGCAVTANVTITDPVELLVNTSSNDASCGKKDGSASVNAAGGVSPYTYQWSNGSTSASADSLLAGMYTVTVTDSNGCKKFAPVMVSDNGAPNVIVTGITQVACNGGSSGAINIAVTGGSSPYNYQWSNGLTTKNITGLQAGPYEVTVTDTTGCVSTKSIIVPQPAAIKDSLSVTDAGCGSADGSVTVTATGGVSPYSYSWSTGATTQTISGLIWGIYQVTITDSKGCTKTDMAAVAETGGPVITIDSVTSSGCSGTGAVYVSVSGGVPPYTFDWTNNNITEDLLDVIPGTYGMIATDDNGCMGAISAEVPNLLPQAPSVCLVTVDSTTGKNLCVFTKDSIMNLGIAYYNFYRETSQSGVYQKIGSKASTVLSQWADQSASPLQKPWRYKVSAVDTCGNESAMSDFHKTIHLVINYGVIPGTINLVWDKYEGFQYGTYYIYRYSNFDGWNLIDSVASTDHSYTDGNLPPSLAGLFYAVEVRPPSMCTATEKAAENHNSSRSNVSTLFGGSTTQPLVATATATDATQGNCDGSATVSVTGGVTPYSYQWNTTPVQTTATATGLCSGNYTVTVTDAANSTSTSSVTVGTQPGVKDASDISSLINVYPNPNRGVFTVSLNYSNKENTHIKVIDMRGRLIYFELLNEVNRNQQVIDISDESGGIYQLQIITGKSIVNKKIIFE